MVTHNKLKLDNIMVCEDATGKVRVKVLNWGFNSIYDVNDCKTNIHNVVYFQAPEILETAVPSDKSDLWSLGAIIYAVLYG